MYYSSSDSESAIIVVETMSAIDDPMIGSSPRGSISAYYASSPLPHHAFNILPEPGELEDDELMDEPSWQSQTLGLTENQTTLNLLTEEIFAANLPRVNSALVYMDELGLSLDTLLLTIGQSAGKLGLGVDYIAKARAENHFDRLMRSKELPNILDQWSKPQITIGGTTHNNAKDTMEEFALRCISASVTAEMSVIGDCLRTRHQDIADTLTEGMDVFHSTKWAEKAGPVTWKLLRVMSEKGQKPKTLADERHEAIRQDFVSRENEDECKAEY